MSAINPLELERQHILLDTCFIIKAKEYSKTEYFDDLFLIFKENNCIPIVNEFIKFEFLSGCCTKEHITIKNNFISRLG